MDFSLAFLFLLLYTLYEQAIFVTFPGGIKYMIEKPFSPVLSNHLTTTFPQLKDYIIKNHTLKQTYKKGEILPTFKEDFLLYISQGSIKSYICDDSGEEKLMYILLEDTLIFGSFHDYFLKKLLVQEPITAYYIPANDIYEFLRTDIEYIKNWSLIIISRYGILLQNQLSINHCSSKHKVYSFIYQLALKYGSAGANQNIITIKNFPSYTDIASITGVHRSNTTTYINELIVQNVLAKKQPDLIIKDMALLEQIIDSLDICKS